VGAGRSLKRAKPGLSLTGELHYAITARESNPEKDPTTIRYHRKRKEKQQLKAFTRGKSIHRKRKEVDTTSVRKTKGGRGAV